MADFDIGSATPTGSLDGSERIPILKNDNPDVVTTDTVHEYSRNLINSAVFTTFANGGSYTVPSNITKLYNTSSAPIGSFTINLPIASYNGQTIQIASNALVSNLTVNPGSGQTLSTFPIEIKANTSFFLTFNDTNDTWYWNESIPSAGNEIYTESFTGNGSDTIFVLTNIPVGEDYTKVYVNGVYQEKSTYTLSGITLTFSVAPPSGTSIEVVVFTAVTHTRLADAVNSAEAFASILSDASLGYIYESIAEVIADPLVEVGSYADVIEDGRHYRVKKTGDDTAEIRAEYSTTMSSPPVLTIAGLPTASTSRGFRATVTDSNAAASGNFGAIVASGGANVVPVYSDGTNWRIG
jgi:hypothetical protein